MKNYGKGYESIKWAEQLQKMALPEDIQVSLVRRVTCFCKRCIVVEMKHFGKFFRSAEC
jgi:hypothetical protein